MKKTLLIVFIFLCVFVFPYLYFYAWKESKELQSKLFNQINSWVKVTKVTEVETEEYKLYREYLNEVRKNILCDNSKLGNYSLPDDYYNTTGKPFVLTWWYSLIREKDFTHSIYKNDILILSWIWNLWPLRNEDFGWFSLPIRLKWQSLTSILTSNWLYWSYNYITSLWFTNNWSDFYYSVNHDQSEVMFNWVKLRTLFWNNNEFGDWLWSFFIHRYSVEEYNCGQDCVYNPIYQVSAINTDRYKRNFYFSIYNQGKVILKDQVSKIKNFFLIWNDDVLGLVTTDDSHNCLHRTLQSDWTILKEFTIACNQVENFCDRYAK